MPQSRAKIAPRHEHQRDHEAEPDRRDLDDPARDVGPLGAQHAGQQQAHDREPEADHSAVPGGTSAMVIITGRGQAERDRLEAQDRGAHAAPRRALGGGRCRSGLAHAGPAAGAGPRPR